MPNTENINKLIEELKKDTGVHFRMDGYVQHIPEADLEEGEDRLLPTRYIECQTAFCIAGWANVMAMIESGQNYKIAIDPDEDGADAFIDLFGDEERAAAWLGITRTYNLFYLGGTAMTMEQFDAIAPEKRRAAGIRVLEILRDTGEVDWEQALADAGIRHHPERWE